MLCRAGSSAASQASAGSRVGTAGGSAQHCSIPQESRAPNPSSYGLSKPRVRARKSGAHSACTTQRRDRGSSQSSPRSCVAARPRPLRLYPAAAHAREPGPIFTGMTPKRVGPAQADQGCRGFK
eukprot:880111-Prymnesium_polylepis.1